MRTSFITLFLAQPVSVKVQGKCLKLDAPEWSLRIFDEKDFLVEVAKSLIRDHPDVRVGVEAVLDYCEIQGISPREGFLRYFAESEPRTDSQQLELKL